MSAHFIPPPQHQRTLREEYLLRATAPSRERRMVRSVAAALFAALAGSALALLSPAFGPGGGLTLFEWARAGFPASDAVEATAAAVPIELVLATRGEQATKGLEGVEAREANAALPFAAGAIEAANPFAFVPASATDQQRALKCLTQAVYYEAATEPLEGRRAVAQVVLNRVRHPAFPSSVCGVVYDGSSRPGCQFSFTCDGSLARAPAPALWAAAAAVAREALAGKVVTAVGLATHYHADYVSPYWAPRLTKLQQVGAHFFYRWPGSWGRQAAFRSRYAGVEAIYRGRIPAATDPALAALPDLPEAAGPAEPRAPNDVGGRVDLTKGWTPSIPLPDESRGRLAELLARQAAASPAAGSSATAAAAPEAAAGGASR